MREEIAPKLSAAGHSITSSWIHEPPSADQISDYLRARKRGEARRNLGFDRYLRGEAERDVLDLQAADLLIRFPAEDLATPSSGGKFCETGMAIAWAIDVAIIGNRESVFDYLPDVKVFEDMNVAAQQLDLGPIEF